MTANNAWSTDMASMSRRSFLKTASLVALMGLCGSSIITGCSSAEAVSGQRAIALVIDKGQNSALADNAGECVYQVFKPIISDGGYMVIDIASSKPSIVCSKAVKRAGNSTELAHENRWRKDKAFVEARNIDEQLPAAEEIDLLKAIKQAADELSVSAGEYDERTIYIASSGIQTCGALDLTGNGPYDDVLGWDNPTLLERIAKDSSSGAIKSEALPDLNGGIHVVWMGMGDLVAGAQCDVPTATVAKLKDLWAQTLGYCGADFDPAVDFVNCPMAASGHGVDRTTLPKVTPVVFDEALSVSTVSFDENVLAFVPGDDPYLDGQEYAESILKPYADSLKETGSEIVVLGTTANDGDRPGCIDLGRRRAERVKSDLVKLGVEPEKVTVCSAGYEAVGVNVGGKIIDFYHDNYNGDGSWNEDAAKTNRAIHILPLALSDDVIERFSV